MSPNLSRAAAAALVLTLAACTPDAPQPVANQDAEPSPALAHAHGAPTSSLRPSEVLRGVAAVRRATARFQELTLAKEAGYTEQYPEGCAESPEGAQAYHWLNPDLVDGSVDLLTPELLMYEPQADGSMRLVGVDYIIPFEEWTSASPPTLLGTPMMRNEPLGVWALHIWAWRVNPSGLFANWNPRVNCRYAAL